MTKLEFPLHILKLCSAVPGYGSTVACDDVREDKSEVDHLSPILTGGEFSASKCMITHLGQWYKNRPTCSVFQAQLRCSRTADDSTVSQMLQVVCKIQSRPKDLQQLRCEASLYHGPLAGIQGTHVPQLIGLFEGEAPEGGIYGVMITSFEGNSLDREFHQYDAKFRLRILDALIAVHRAGVRHGDVGRANIVVNDDGMPKLVDFGSASPNHCCKIGPSNPITLNAPMPVPKDSGLCGELWEAANEADIWCPASFRFAGWTVEIPIGDALQGWDHLLKCVQKLMPDTPDRATDGAKRIIEVMNTWIERRKRYDDDVSFNLTLT